MSPTHSRAGGLAAALSLTLVGALALPAVAADSAEGAVNELIDAVEAGDFESIDALVCEAEREAVREQLDPGGSMGLSADEFPLTLQVEDRALEVISEDGDEVTIRLTGTMSMNVEEDDIEALALAMLEADMGDELSEEDIEMMLPFMTMAFTQTVPMDEEITVVNEDGEWLICGGLGEASADDVDFDDDFGGVAEVEPEGVCGLATAEEVTAAGVLQYDAGSGWELTSCSYQNWETYHNATVTVELDTDAAYAAGAYGADRELEVAGGPAFTSDYDNAPLIVQVGPDMLRVEVWPPDPAPDGYDGLQQATAIAELFAPRVAESREDLIEPVKPLLCDLGFAADLEAALDLPMHSGSVDGEYCNFESRDAMSVRANVSEGALDDLLTWYPDSQETTIAGLPAFEVLGAFDESAFTVNVGLSDEQVLSITVEPATYDKPLAVSGLDVAELLTQHIVDKSAE